MLNIEINKKLHGADGAMNLEVKLNIKKREFVALTGKSGAGKSTLLRILSGLEGASGSIEMDDEVWQKDGFLLPVQKRKIGFVFQDYALFPNMTVEENLLFVKKDRALAKKLLEITELLKLKDRFPKSLSGGQQQRVSLCRALMNRPKLLLMDEPLSALDSRMRTKLQEEIVKLHKEFGTTTIMVSHDASEIYKMASRVVVLELGEVADNGLPKELLLKRREFKKESLSGEIIDIVQQDKKSVAIVSLEQQLTEIPLTLEESKRLTIGEFVEVRKKEFIV